MMDAAVPMASMPAAMSGRNGLMRRLIINSTDDERNPPDLGVMERELKKGRNARMLWVPGCRSGRAAPGQWSWSTWSKTSQPWRRSVAKPTVAPCGSVSLGRSWPNGRPVTIGVFVCARSHFNAAGRS